MPIHIAPLDIIPQKPLKCLFRLIDESQQMGLLNARTTEFLKVHNPITAVFHHLPKLHKSQVPILGRFIVAGIGSLLEPLYEWVDSHLHPFVQRLPDDICDTGHVLHKLQNAKWTDDLDNFGCHCIVLLHTPLAGFGSCKISPLEV